MPHADRDLILRAARKLAGHTNKIAMVWQNDETGLWHTELYELVTSLESARLGTTRYVLPRGEVTKP